MTDLQKRTIHVGNLPKQADQQIVKSLFEPFGLVKNIEIPLHPITKKPKNFAFVTFEDEIDAEFAIDNMNNAEFFGKFIRVKYSKPVKYDKNKAIWENEEWLKKHGNKEEEEMKMEEIQDN